MNDLLFPVKESLSPRLKWMREHEIQSYECPVDEDPWCAVVVPKGQTFGDVVSRCREDDLGYGDTENEALIALAQKLNIPLWNQSPGPHVAESDQ